MKDKYYAVWKEGSTLCLSKGLDSRKDAVKIAGSKSADSGAIVVRGDARLVDISNILERQHDHEIFGV